MSDSKESVKLETYELGISELPPSTKMRVKFGYWVLGFLGLYILISMFMYYCAAPLTAPSENAQTPKLEAARALFGFSKELLPLATLILGYFFGSRGENGE